MREGEPSFETERPEVLDIVKIDSRWAQVIGGGDAVQFLDDGSAHPIEWDQYSLSRSFPVKGLENLMDLGEVSLTEDEIQRIHRPGDKEDPRLKLFAPVFGEYKKIRIV